MESTGIGLSHQPHGSLTSTFAGHRAHFQNGRPCCTAVGERITSRAGVDAARRAASSQNRGDAWVDAANLMSPNWSRSAQPHPLPGRGRAATADADHCWSRPRRWAIAAASPRPATPSLARILETWMLAVLGVMNSAWPICRFAWPWQPA
jgi:hypothetical protein